MSLDERCRRSELTKPKRIEEGRLRNKDGRNDRGYGSNGLFSAGLRWASSVGKIGDKKDEVGSEGYDGPAASRPRDPSRCKTTSAFFVSTVIERISHE